MNSIIVFDWLTISQTLDFLLVLVLWVHFACCPNLCALTPTLLFLVNMGT
jgi:hypothetical protein